MHCSSYAPPMLLSVSDSARALDRRKNCGDTLSRSSQLLNGESFKTSAYAIHNSASRCVFVAVGCSIGWPECTPVCRCRRFSSSSEMPHASRKCCPSSPCGVLPNPAPLCVRFMHLTPIERYHARPHAIDAPLRSAPGWLHRCPTTARTAAPQWTPCWAGVLTVARCVPTASAAEAAFWGVGFRYMDRHGGYTRVLRTRFRRRVPSPPLRPLCDAACGGRWPTAAHSLTATVTVTTVRQCAALRSRRA